MKTILFWVISGIIMIGLNNPVQTNVAADCASEISKITNFVDDEEPIMVRGHIRNGGGYPIVGASVKLKQGGVVQKQTTTNSSGYYQMSGVQAGNYVLHLSADGYVTKTVELSISAEIIRADTLVAE